MRQALAPGLVAAALLLSGCVTPAPDTSAYESKAGMTAEAADSAAATALVATRAYLHGRMGSAYLETVLVDAEESLGSVHDTFDSVQPPAAEAADVLRSTLDPLLEKAGSALTDLRIAARRNSSPDLRTAVGALSPVADRLEAFGKQHAS